MVYDSDHGSIEKKTKISNFGCTGTMISIHIKRSKSVKIREKSLVLLVVAQRLKSALDLKVLQCHVNLVVQFFRETHVMYYYSLGIH